VGFIHHKLCKNLHLSNLSCAINCAHPSICSTHTWTSFTLCCDVHNNNYYYDLSTGTGTIAVRGHELYYAISFLYLLLRLVNESNLIIISYIYFPPYISNIDYHKLTSSQLDSTKSSHTRVYQKPDISNAVYKKKVKMRSSEAFVHVST
jgi:hypothetical protein